MILDAIPMPGFNDEMAESPIGTGRSPRQEFEPLYGHAGLKKCIYVLINPVTKKADIILTEDQCL